MYRLSYKFVESNQNQNLGQKVLILFGFVTLMGSVRFEFYICFLHVSSSSVRFFPKYGF